MAITVNSARWRFLGTLFFDVSVDSNASVFYRPGRTVAVGNEEILTADILTLCDSFLIVCISTSLTGTVNLQVLGHTGDDETADASWHILQSGGSDIALVADKATAIDTAIAAPALRLFSTGAEAADRTFYIYGRRPA